MRHYVSYHNADKMGYSFEESNPFLVGTKKAVNRLVGTKIWSVAGVSQPRDYYLGSWFVVDEVGNSEQEQFDRYVSGTVGQVFNPMVALSSLPWFAPFLKSQNHFSLGLQVIKEEFVAHLEALAEQNPNKLAVEPVFPDEVDVGGSYREGAVRQVIVNAHERNQKAKQHCIRHYGTNCSLCGFNFGKVYGTVVEGLIHVHHLRALSEIEEEYTVDPIADLRPVCPNCHAVLHARTPAYGIEEVVEFLRKQKDEGEST